MEGVSVNIPDGTSSVSSCHAQRGHRRGTLAKRQVQAEVVAFALATPSAMRSRRTMKLVPILGLLVILGGLTGCVTPTAPADDPNQTAWTLQPDKDTREGVVLQKGESQASVVERMGMPRRKDRSKKDPAIEVYLYQRTVYGPIVQRTMSTARGPIVVQKPTFYVDEVAITFIAGVIDKVTVDRRVEQDNRGVPRLH